MNTAFDPRKAEDLETLAGRRGPTDMHAVRRKELAAAIEQMSIQASKLATLSGTVLPDLSELQDSLAAAEAELDTAAEAINSVANLAGDVRADHDALTSGFVGTLTERFTQADADIANAAQSALADKTSAVEAAAEATVARTGTLDALLAAVRAARAGAQKATTASEIAGNYDFQDGWAGWAVSDDLNADLATVSDIVGAELTADDGDTLYGVLDALVLTEGMRDAEQQMRTEP